MKQATRCAAIAAMMIGCTGLASAQYVPAGMQGAWKLHRVMNTHHGGLAGSCLGGVGQSSQVDGKQMIGSTLSLGEHAAEWQGKVVPDVKPKMHTLSATEFTQEYLAPNGSLKDLGLQNAAEVQVLTLDPAGTLPIDTVLARNPSTLLLGRCGLFYEAVRDGSYKAPRIPDSQ